MFWRKARRIKNLETQLESLRISNTILSEQWESEIKKFRNLHAEYQDLKAELKRLKEGNS